MPYISQAYLQYLEQQMGDTGQSTSGSEPPPADLNDPFQNGIAPFGPPSQGGPGSYPSSPTPSPTQTPTPPGQGLEFPGSNLPLPPGVGAAPAGLAPGSPNDQFPLPSGGAPPYDNSGAGTDAVDENLPNGGWPTDQQPATDELPPPPTTASGPQPGAPNDQFPLPTNQAPQTPGGNNFIQNLGNFFRGIAGLFPSGHGGFGEPMGFFPAGTTMPPGTSGIVNAHSPAGGGSFFGGRGNLGMSLPGSFFNLGASGGTIESMGGKIAWHEVMPQFGGMTLAQVAKQHPEWLPGLANLSRPDEGSPSQQTGGGKVLPSKV